MSINTKKRLAYLNDNSIKIDEMNNESGGSEEEKKDNLHATMGFGGYDEEQGGSFINDQ